VYPDSVFERLRQHFSEAQIVEVTLRITLCGFNDALQIEEEDDAQAKLA
jgi:alkylhydroperoxidase family enzyme